MRPDRHPVKTMRCTAIDRGFDADTPRLPRGATRGDVRPSEARPSGGALISLTLFALLSLSACGYVGNPQAPTLDIPQLLMEIEEYALAEKEAQRALSVNPSSSEALAVLAAPSIRAAPVPDAVMWRMTDVIAHRGPDDSAIYHSAAGRRLARQDPPALAAADAKRREQQIERARPRAA